MRSCARVGSLVVEKIIRGALEEDLGSAGDITSKAVIPAGTRAVGTVVARESGVIAGPNIAAGVFELLDSGVHVEVVAGCGDRVVAGGPVLKLEGPARSILAAERTALNLLGRLSGIATLTRAMVDAVEGTGCRIADTRKTTPGLRAMEKAAVRAGGGSSHRWGLFDAVLIKDNHLALAGSVGEAVRRARDGSGHTVTIEVEVESLADLDEALEAGADVVLLDNMAPAMLEEAVRRARGKAITEASGGITLENVRAVAETGVDVISVGALTHSAPALDVSLELDPLAP